MARKYEFNEADIRVKLIVVFLILMVGIGTSLQFLEGSRLDDEQVKIPYVPTHTTTSSSYIGTASTTTTTI